MTLTFEMKIFLTLDLKERVYPGGTFWLVDDQIFSLSEKLILTYNILSFVSFVSGITSSVFLQIAFTGTPFRAAHPSQKLAKVAGYSSWNW